MPRSFRELRMLSRILRGGSGSEAIRTGRFLRKHLIAAWSPWSFTLDSASHGMLLGVCSGEGCICSSACALIWFGAVRRSGSVGLHMSTFDGRSSHAPVAEFRKFLRKLKEYLKEMEVPRHVIDIIETTGSDDIHRIGTQEQQSRAPSQRCQIGR